MIIAALFLLKNQFKTQTRTLLSLGLVCGLVLLSTGCSPSMKTLDDYVTGQGFIPYTTPVQDAGPGTIIGGTPSELTFIAPPETCFPDTLPNGAPTNLRDSFPASLPSEASNISATGSLSVQLTNLVTQLTGVANFQAGASFSDLTEVDLQVGTAAIDSMNLVALQSYYQNGMSSDCQQYLNIAGFVLEGLKVNQLTFQFKTSSGAAINLTGSFASSVTAGASGSYEVQNETSLVITSPTYIGYQLGSLRLGSGGFTLYRAADIASGTFDFKALSIFPGAPAPAPAPAPAAAAAGAPGSSSSAPAPSPAATAVVARITTIDRAARYSN